MAQRTYRVRVFVKAVDPTAPAGEDHNRGFSLQTSNPDKAATIARARLEDAGAEVLSVSHGPENVVLATISRERRKGPPTTLVASVASRRMR